MEEPKTYYYTKAIRYVSYYILFTYIRSLIKNPRAIVWFTLILAGVIGLSKRRYFPYFSRLLMDEHHVVKSLFGDERICLDLQEVTVVKLKIYKTDFVAFLLEPLGGVTLPEVAKLQKRKKAIMYPYMPEMGEDFPELFKAIA